tara:strand:+ start:1762 stop:2559 length:798 start_codon:yes stop_codon:yes gene_type:complete
MTTSELSNEFDIYYNSIASNSAPGIDLFEKSVYLTKAQLEIINNYFNPEGNKYKKGFEASSKRRTDLRELIRPGISTLQSSVLDADDGVSPDSQFFRIPNEVYFIIQEKGRVLEREICGSGSNKVYLKSVPKTHDEFNVQEGNPFKKPDGKTIWRLDMYSPISTDTLGASSIIPLAYKVVELISPYNIDQYKFRYVKYPEPIILGNLLDEYPDENLSIDGVTAEQTCALGNSIAREIVYRAVDLAVSDYKPQELAQRIQMSQRNE